MNPPSRQSGCPTLAKLGWVCLLLTLLLPTPARAHIGSKDVFQQIDTGPYRLYVTVRTPVVIPGVATIEARSSGAAIRSLDITPLPMVGEASKHPPTADAMQPSTSDPAFFTGSLWLMASGSWQVRIAIDGAAGKASAGVPVPAMPLSVLPMQRSLAVILAILGIILILGMASIVAAAVRESRLAPGVEPTPARRRKAAIASGITLALLALAVFLGNKWWKVEAASYAADIYRPSDLHARLTGDTLSLQVGNYNPEKHTWGSDSLDHFLPDHGHLMHLYAIRQPGMDAAFHLHPAPVPHTDDTLSLPLPAMPPGTYRLYADIVRRSGFPETLTTELTVPPGLTPAPLSPEDASAFPPSLNFVKSDRSDPGLTTKAEGGGQLGPAYKLPDGYTMVWDRPATITANTGYSFRFTLLDPTGKPATDMQPYLGMPGHAAWVKADGSTFAHTHPEGSAAMPALMLAQANASPGTAASTAGAQPMSNMGDMGSNMGNMASHEGEAVSHKDDQAGTAKPLFPTVEFPYGFPAPGRYRVFIQMKHSATVETGVFDAEAK